MLLIVKAALCFTEMFSLCFEGILWGGGKCR